MTDQRVDLSELLFPPQRYHPHPTLVPNRLVLHGVDRLKLADLRRLGTCSDDGPDAVYAPVERTPELSMDPEADAPPVVHGGLNVSRAIVEVSSAGPDGKPVKVVSWWSSVTGLTFHADDDGRVYVDGPECRVILFDPADERWPECGFRPIVHADERQGPGSPLGPEWVPCGKEREYESYAALVVERNAQRLRGTHGRVPDALASLMGMAPMIDKKRNPTTVISAMDRTEPHGFGVRRVGRRVTMRLDEATAKRLHGERGDSGQAVLRFDAPVEASAEDVDQAAMQLLREFDTETLVTVIGLLINANDTGNRPQNIGSADLARVRGKELSSAKERKPYAAMSTLLAGVVIEVRPVGDDTTTARLNLFARQGEVVVRGGHRIPRVTLNADLYHAMLRRGHGVLIDRRLLSIDLNAHEWEARINVALATQWALGWVRNGYAKGKRLRRTAKVLLAEAGIPYDLDAERRKRGATAVRQRISTALDGLVALRHDLKSWKRTKQAVDPADDTYEFTPSDALSTRLTTLRHPALAAPPERPALDAPKPAGKRKRTTGGRTR